MLQLRQKRKDKRGFTLMEMLIVVAIIAILVAIAVPAINSNLDGAKQAADSANERNAKTLIAVGFANGTITADTVYELNDQTGSLQTAVSGSLDYGKVDAAKDKILIKISSAGAITTEWVAKTVTAFS
jgi:type IV pilus assembly protein PilA